MTARNKSEKKLTIQDISVNSVDKIMSKYESSNTYSSAEKREAELEINDEFLKLNKQHEEAQELIAQELANIII